MPCQGINVLHAPWCCPWNRPGPLDCHSWFGRWLISRNFHPGRECYSFVPILRSASPYWGLCQVTVDLLSRWPGCWLFSFFPSRDCCCFYCWDRFVWVVHVDFGRWRSIRNYVEPPPTWTSQTKLVRHPAMWLPTRN